MTTQQLLQPHETWTIIDSSKLARFCECPRSYFYEYLLGWRSTTPRQDLVFGEAVHAGLEILYRLGFSQLELANLILEDTYRKSFDPITDEMYSPKTPANAQDALAAYCDYYRSDATSYEVLHTEVSGKTALEAGMDLYFRLDTVLRDRQTGQIFVLEHKTSKRGGSTWYDQWPLSLQVGTYTHALYGLPGYTPTEIYGVRINGLIFLKRETRFERVPCARTADQMDTWYQTALYWYTKLLAHQEILLNDQATLARLKTFRAFPMNPTSCTRWGTCRYHDFCKTWPNPLQHCAETPIGFAVEYWDPRKHYEERKREDIQIPETKDFSIF